MFKSKIAISVMLVGLICGTLFMCVSEYPSGSDPWAYPCTGGIVALIYVLAFTGKKGKREGVKRKDEKIL